MIKDKIKSTLHKTLIRLLYKDKIDKIKKQNELNEEIQKPINEKEKNSIIHIQTEESYKQSKEGKRTFPSLQKTFTFNFEYELIKKINELSNKRIAILLEYSLRIYNIDSFKKLEEIKLPILSYCHYEKQFFDFIELKNSDLVLWSPENIFFL